MVSNLISPTKMGLLVWSNTLAYIILAPPRFQMAVSTSTCSAALQRDTKIAKLLIISLCTILHILVKYKIFLNTRKPSIMPQVLDGHVNKTK